MTLADYRVIGVRLLDVLPCFSARNQGDVGLTDVVLASDSALADTTADGRTNEAHHLYRQLCPTHRFAASKSFRVQVRPVPITTRACLRTNTSGMPIATGHTLGVGPGRMSIAARLAILRHHIARVIGRRPQKKMGRVTASGVIAAMTNKHAIGNFPTVQYPGDPMGVLLTPFEPNRAIAATVMWAASRPTRQGACGAIDRRVESVRCCRLLRRVSTWARAITLLLVAGGERGATVRANMGILRVHIGPPSGVPCLGRLPPRRGFVMPNYSMVRP